MATLEELYNALKSDGAPLPETYEKFATYMTSGPQGGYEHRKKFMMPSRQMGHHCLIPMMRSAKHCLLL